jgi:hypothetical protein
MLIDCLEVVIADRRVAVPTLAVERVAEIEVCGPPPLGETWVGGFGRSSTELVVTLSLARGREASSDPVRTVTAVLLRELVARCRWGIEIDRVVGFRQVAAERVEDAPDAGWACPPGWVACVRGETPRLVLLDPTAMRLRLADGRPPGEAA